MSSTVMTDLGGIVAGDEGRIKPQTAADATAIVGAIIDRQGYDSGVFIGTVNFTSSSGASGGKNTLAIAVYHDSASDMSGEASLKSDSYEYTWAADGANDGVHVLPVSFETANRYVRGKLTLTKGGTITISNQYVSGVFILGGLQVSPDAAYVSTGYEKTTEAA